MVLNNRIVNSLLIYGDKGLGKKTAAEYISASLLCEKGTGIPCGECRSCKKIANMVHPDVIHAVASGKSGNYKIDAFREMVENASVMPNESRFKIYIIADMDNTLAAAQNALLKLIEEPPDHCVIILTASSRSSLLPTIVSRVVSLPMHEISLDSCKNALIQKGYEKDSVQDAVEALGGNLGKCIGYLNGGDIVDAVTMSKSITDAIITGDEYLMLKEFSELIGDKTMTLAVFKLLCEIVRDSISVSAGCDKKTLISAYKAGAIRLSERISKITANKIYYAITKYAERINSNGNLSLAINALCSEMKEAL